MTREEAARVLTELADEYEKYELSKNGWLGTTYIPAHRMGVAALREKQQREAGCEWCTKLTNLSYSDASYYDDIRACVGMQKDIHILERHKKDDYVLNISSHAGNWIDYPIHYCPMCGRKLEDEK